MHRNHNTLRNHFFFIAPRANRSTVREFIEQNDVSIQKIDWNSVNFGKDHGLHPNAIHVADLHYEYIAIFC